MRKFLIATGILFLTASQLLVNSQPSQADVICFPWETSCVPNGRPFSSSYFTVYAHNKTNKTIWVATHYLRESLRDNFQDDYWISDGYWELAPGEKAMILSEKTRIVGRNIYFHAHDANGKVWGNNYRFDVCNPTSLGECTSQKFFASDMGSKYGEFTQVFR